MTRDEFQVHWDRLGEGDYRGKMDDGRRSVLLRDGMGTVLVPEPAQAPHRR